MKKIFLFFILYFCTSFSYATIYERHDLNVIINSHKVNFSSTPITYNDFTLVPIKSILSYFDFPNSIDYHNKALSVRYYDSILSLNINSKTAYIDSIPISLDIAPIIYKNFTYVPLKIISSFFDCYIYYDNQSKSIFIKDLNEYQQIESFFDKLNKNLNTVNSLKIDVINELSNKNSSFSFGNCLFLNKTTNTLLMKSVLEDTWKESNIKIDFTNNAPFNPEFFAGISFDRLNSNENQMIFEGFYPANGILCKAKIYVDPESFYITKQENKFSFYNINIKQTVFYNYNTYLDKL